MIEFHVKYKKNVFVIIADNEAKLKQSLAKGAKIIRKSIILKSCANIK